MGNLDFDGPEQTIMRTSLSRPQQCWAETERWSSWLDLARQ